MITETISCTTHGRLNLNTVVRCADLEFPSSIPEVEKLLTAHVLSCRHCLAAVLLCGETLRETGCEEYRGMLERIEVEGRLREAITSGDHVTEQTIEEYCFDRLNQAEAAAFDEHVGECNECAQRLADEREFMTAIRMGLKESAERETLRGVIHVRVPQWKQDANVIRELRIKAV